MKKSRSNKPHILMLKKDDSKREIEFEITFQLSLTEKQRYKRLKKLVQKTMKYVKKNDYPKTPSIISRA